MPRKLYSYKDNITLIRKVNPGRVCDGCFFANEPTMACLEDLPGTDIQKFPCWTPGQATNYIFIQIKPRIK